MSDPHPDAPARGPSPGTTTLGDDIVADREATADAVGIEPEHTMGQQGRDADTGHPPRDPEQ